MSNKRRRYSTRNNPHESDVDESLPPAKRVCEIPPDDAAPGATQSIPTRTDVEMSAEFYFSGKMVVLIAEKTAFCVHRDLLSQRSEVFSDMFSLAIEGPTGEKMDGHPVVEVSDKKADWDAFLKAFYGNYIISTSNDPLTMSGILRIANKYGFDSIRSKCLSSLDTIFPRTLDGWDNPKISKSQKPFPQYLPIITELNLTHLLPSALYRCCDIKGKDTMAYLQGCTKTMEKLLDGKMLIAAQFQRFIIDVLHKIKMALCCSRHWKTVISKAQSKSMETQSFKDPLKIILGFSSVIDAEVGFCQQCRVRYSRKMNSLRKDIWAELPKIFNVADNWAKLEPKK